MQKTKLKRTTAGLFAGVVATGLMATSFMMPQQVNAATAEDCAKITVGKTLTTDGGSFPSIENFSFELEAVSGYTNPNVSTSVDGQTITAAQVPMPSGTSGTKVTVNVGDFTTNQSGDTATKKTRTNAFSDIQYTTAGYYMYKISEVIPANKVAGVTYDETSYYAIVYVVNNTDSDLNTTSGVKVASITAWHNEKGSNANMPDLQDIADGGKDFDGTLGDNATLNDDHIGDFTKVGVTPPPTPNELDAYKFLNSQSMHDVSLTKNVKGTLGDVTKQFEFTVTMTGLEASKAYTITKTGGATLVSASVGSVDNTANTVTTDASGNVTFLAKVADDQGITIKDIPEGATYAMSEAASNHEASYQVTATNNSAVIAKASDENAAKETALATATETVDANDGDVTVAYENARNLETITGIASYVMYLVAAGVAALMALLFTKRRKAIREM